MTERIYRTEDKSTWGDGPWQDEPDKISWHDEKTGFACLLKRNRMGCYCGYIGLTPDHPLYGVDYSDIDVDVHGGLTYSDYCEDGPEETSICHVPKPGEPDDLFWIGFDTCHITDRLPAFEARHKDLFGDESTFVVEWATYKTLAYCRAEVEYLAAQLARVTVDETSTKSLRVSVQ